MISKWRRGQEVFTGKGHLQEEYNDKCTKDMSLLTVSTLRCSLYA